MIESGTIGCQMPSRLVDTVVVVVVVAVAVVVALAQDSQ